MARMYPQGWPADCGNSAEWRLYETLRDGLDRSYAVIHSLPWLDDSGRRLGEGECDFLILHPERGLLAIEAKAGGIRYDGPARAWRRGEGAAAHTIKDPFRQAASSAHHLNALLVRRAEEWRRLEPPYGHAVAFPEADHLPGNLPPHASPDILVMRPDLARLQARIETIMGRYRPPSGCLMPEAFERAIAALLPVFQVGTPLSARLDAQDNALVRLSAEQTGVLDLLAEQRRAVIEGVAGSGKTMLAVEKAVRLAADGARVLLCCFNIPLAQRLATLATERGAAAVDVWCFHDLAAHVVTSTGGVYEAPLENRQRFYDHSANELLLEALPRHTVRYDAVIVDEAQDFLTDWWLSLEELLADRERGVFYIFIDRGQDLFARGARLPFEQPRFALTTNCRNTRRIADLVQPYGCLAGRASAFAPEGVEPRFTQVAGEGEEREAVRRTLHGLVNEQGVRPERIVILGRHRFEHSAFAAQPRLGGFQIIDTLEPGALHQIRYATIYRFKGLEADIVLLTGVTAGREAAPAAASIDPDERTFFYVAASRARLLLHVFPRRRAAATA